MTAASACIRLWILIAIALISITAMTGIGEAQYSMGRLTGPTPGPRTAQTPPAKSQAGLTPGEQKQFAEAMKRLTPKERKRLTKAIKRFTPEETRQFVEGVKHQLAVKGTDPRAIKRVR